MGLYIALFIIALCIRYSKSQIYAELFGLLLSAFVIVLQWGEKGVLAIFLIALIVIIRRHKNSRKDSESFILCLVLLALVWYGEAKYSTVSYVVERIGVFELKYDTVIAVIGASYILMRLLNYILEKNHKLSFQSSLHYILFAPALPTGPIQTVEV